MFVMCTFYGRTNQANKQISREDILKHIFFSLASFAGRCEVQWLCMTIDNFDTNRAAGTFGDGAHYAHIDLSPSKIFDVPAPLEKETIVGPRSHRL